MTPLDRRDFLRRAAAWSAGGACSLPWLAGLVACNDAAARLRERVGTPALPGGGYGALVRHPTLAFHVPRGFRLARLGRAGDPMDDGARIPNAHDGMCALHTTGGALRLLRNHELRDEPRAGAALGPRPYDPLASAGCTTVEVALDPVTHEPRVVREFVSLGGTAVSCAGGSTPWGSWLSCEETTAGPAQGFGRPHGYVFEVPADADEAVEPIPLRAMGRFRHEAVAVDPVLGHVYLTEDHRDTSGFYRFLPDHPRDLRAGGRLQMLRAVGRPRLATHRGRRAGFRPLVPIPVEWVDIPVPDPALERGEPRTFEQGLALGAASFARLEGCWWGGDGCFFNATRGGAARAGQVWHYRSQGADGGELVLVFESPGRHVLDSPDHICVSPRGGLVLCEDGDDEQYLRGLTRDGTIFDLAATADATDELAGACFSPDGRILFFNSLGGATSSASERGATYALWGPWEEGVL